MLKNILLVTSIIIQSPAISAEDSAAHQTGTTELIRLQDILTGAVRGKGIINLDPESVRTFLENDLHRSTTATSAHPRHTAQIDSTHIKAIIGNGNDAVAFGQFYSYKTDLSNIQVDGDCNTIYIINGVGNTKSLTEKGTLSLTVDKQGSTTIKHIVQGLVSDSAVPQFKEEQNETVVPQDSTTPEAAPVSTSSSPTSSIKLPITQKGSSSPLKKLGRIFKRTSSSSSSSSLPEAGSSSPTSRKNSTPPSPQAHALNQQLAKELEKRNSRH
ncbi:MAG: hypothetical protein KF820_00530 [Candidatus Paracaedibacteraceae bacterium]|nr:hypothetical protein [Candidatus Paracaedibacteraceae bacterium]